MGISFHLSLTLNCPGRNSVDPKRTQPALRSTLNSDNSYYYNQSWRDYHLDFEDVSSDNSVLLHTQHPTQWDSLGHAGTLFDANGDEIGEIAYYNGWRGGKHIRGPSDVARTEQNGSVKAERLGIENMAVTCVKGRGVLVDLHKRFGIERVFFGFDDLELVI